MSDPRIPLKPRIEASAYAKLLGINTRLLRQLGGMDRLKVMTPDARAVLLNVGGFKRSRNTSGHPFKRSLKSIGMLPQRAGKDTQRG